MHEGNFFTFDGIDSQIFGARICQFGESSYTYSGGSNIELITDKTTRSHKSTLLGTKSLELSFNMAIYFEHPLTLYDINEVKTWLFGHSKYKKLYIQDDDYANIYYNCILTDPEDIIYNGFNAIRFKVNCDSGGAWRDETVWNIKFSDEDKNRKEAYFTIINNSALNDYTYPKVKIDISYSKLPNGGKPSNLISIERQGDELACNFNQLDTDEYGEQLDIEKELITIDNETGYIESWDSDQKATYIATFEYGEPLSGDYWFDAAKYVLRRWNSDLEQWSLVNVKVGDTILLKRSNKKDELVKCVVSETGSTHSTARFTRLPRIYTIPAVQGEDDLSKEDRVSELLSSEYFGNYDYYIISDNPGVVHTAGITNSSPYVKTLTSEAVSSANSLCYTSLDNGILYFKQYNEYDNFWYDYCLTNKTPAGKDYLFWAEPSTGTIRQFIPGEGWSELLKKFDSGTHTWVDTSYNVAFPDISTIGFFSSAENMMFTRDNRYNWSRSTEYVGSISATIITSMEQAVNSHGFNLLISETESKLIYRKTTSDEWMIYPFVHNKNNVSNLYIRDENSWDYYSYNQLYGAWRITPPPFSKYVYYFVNYWGIKQKLYKREILDYSPIGIRNRFTKFNKEYIRLERGANKFRVRGLIPNSIQFTYSEFVRIGG